jgi:DNA repair protein RadD
MIILRPYQQKIIEDTRHAFLTHRSVLIQSPTGSGKTATTAEMLRLASLKGKRSWFIVHRMELVKQSAIAFHNAGIKVGIVAAGFPEAKKMPVQVCSIQTLARRHTKLQKPDFICWDECHHIAASSYEKIYSAYKDQYHIGLTATPARTDGSGLDKFFSHMVRGPEVSWLIDNGYLSKYRLFAPSAIKTDGMHTKMGDFVKSELTLAADKPSITGDAIKHYQKLCHGKRAIVFCVSVEHSKHVTAQFVANGIPAEHVDGETEKELRDGAMKRFQSGETLVLVNVELFGEGVDVPCIEAVLLLRPTMSLGLHLQQIGRGLRAFPGKETAYILDHAGNAMRHGLPDDTREWSLKGIDKNKKSQEKSPSVRICPSCFAAQRSGELKCRFCGHKFEIKYRKVDQQQGELQEIDIIKARRTRFAEQGRAESLQDLIALGKKRGYKFPHRWAHFVLQSRKHKQEMKK